MLAAVAWCREASDHDLLLFDRLDLQPAAAAHAGKVGTLAQLGHDALQLIASSRRVESLSLADDVLGVTDQCRGSQHVLEQALSILEGNLEKALAVGVDHVEDHVLESYGLVGPVLKQLKGRAPLRVHGHDLAVQDRLPGRKQIRQEFQLRILEVDRTSAPSLEGGLAVAYEADQSDAVPLDLEEPAIVVESLVHQAGLHRLECRRHRPLLRLGQVDQPAPLLATAGPDRVLPLLDLLPGPSGLDRGGEAVDVERGVGGLVALLDQQPVLL